MIMRQLFSRGILLFISYFILLLIIFQKIISNYYPSEDEFSLLTNSTLLFGNISFTDWITRGFTDYFKVFPEWAMENYSNFMRPIVNLTYLSNSILFKENYQLYLLVNYLVHAGGSYISFAIARYYFKLSLLPSIAVSGVMFLVPSFDNYFQIYPAFCFDGLAAILSVISMFLIIKNRIWCGALVILLAIFTKETVLWTPFAAAALLIVTKKSLKGAIGNVVMVLVPFLLWFVIRKIFFTSFSGNFAFKSTNIISVAGHLIVGFLNWPSALLKENTIYNLMYSLINKRIEALVCIPVVIIVFNITTYAVIFWGIYKAIRRDKDTEVKSLAIYLLGSLMFIVFLGLEARFGYLFYLLFIPLGMHLLYVHKIKFLKPVIIIFFIVISLNGIYQINNTINGHNYENYLMDKKFSKQLIALLHQHKDKKKIYLINDVTARYSSMESLAAFSKIKSKIIKINSISNDFNLLCRNSENELKINFNYIQTGKYLVTMELPPKIHFVFQGIDENKTKRDPGRFFKRNADLNYQFPGEKIVKYRMSTGTPVYDYGKLLNVEINQPQREDIIIYFNKGYKTIDIGKAL